MVGMRIVKRRVNERFITGISGAPSLFLPEELLNGPPFPVLDGERGLAGFFGGDLALIFLTGDFFPEGDLAGDDLTEEPFLGDGERAALEGVPERERELELCFPSLRARLRFF